MHKLLLILVSLSFFSFLPAPKLAHVNSVIGTEAFKKQFKLKIENRVETSIESFKVPLIEWQLALLLNKNQIAYKEKTAFLCKQLIVSTLSKNKPSLTDLIPLIQFWEKIQKQNTEAFFLETIEILWVLKRNFNRAQELTLFLSHRSQESKDQICCSLQRSFSYFLNNNDLEGLIHIYPLLKKFDIDAMINNKQQLIKNHIADAEYHLAQGEHEEAKIRLHWVLLLQENETKALSILNSIDKS